MNYNFKINLKDLIFKNISLFLFLSLKSQNFPGLHHKSEKNQQEHGYFGNIKIAFQN